MTRREGAKARAKALAQLVIQSDVVTRVPDGRYGPASYSGVTGAVVEAENPSRAVFAGDPGRGEDNTIRIEDGCEITFRGMRFENFWRALWPTVSKIVLEDCVFDKNGELALMAGGCDPMVTRRCVARNSGQGQKPPNPDHPEISANHAWYYSWACQNSLLIDSDAFDCQGCGLHTNWAAEKNVLQHNFHGENLRLFGCGSEGTPCIQPDGTRASSLLNILVANSPIGIFTWYNDGEGPNVACQDWTIENITAWHPSGKFNIHVGAGTQNIVYRRGIFVLADAPLIDSADTLQNLPASVRYRHEAWATVRTHRSRPVTVVPGSAKHRELLEAAHAALSFEDCLFFAHHPSHVPTIYRSGNTVKDINEAAALFPRAASLDFTPADAGVTQGWRKRGAPTPTPTPTPETKWKPCPSCIGAGFPAGKVPQ